MQECLRYFAAACQTDQPNPTRKSEMKRNTQRMLQMIDHAVVGYAPFMPVKLVVFPNVLATDTFAAGGLGFG